MSRGIRSSILIVASLAVLAIVVSAATARPKFVPGGYTNCHLSSENGYGYSYLTGLWVRHLGCQNGKTVVRHRGGKGWHCSTTRLDTGVANYDSYVKCSKGRMRTLWSFEQNT